MDDEEEDDCPEKCAFIRHISDNPKPELLKRLRKMYDAFPDQCRNMMMEPPKTLFEESMTEDMLLVTEKQKEPEGPVKMTDVQMVYSLITKPTISSSITQINKKDKKAIKCVELFPLMRMSDATVSTTTKSMRRKKHSSTQ